MHFTCKQKVISQTNTWSRFGAFRGFVGMAKGGENNPTKTWSS